MVYGRRKNFTLSGECLLVQGMGFKRRESLGHRPFRIAPRVRISSPRVRLEAKKISISASVLVANVALGWMKQSGVQVRYKFLVIVRNMEGSTSSRISSCKIV
jgi:hypothetical protein